MMQTGVLLVNLGTPLSPKPADVYRYLIEFLTDERVIDLPWLKRQLLVRGVIVPFRYKESSRAYQQIWTKEGSPLLVFGRKVQQDLQNILGHEFIVELGMRYQSPSLEQSISNLMRKNIKHLIVIPLFPQYASATTGSVQQKVQEILGGYQVIPKLTILDQFATHPSLIDAFCTVANEQQPENFDHVLFSFHGLPERHLKKADCSGTCLASTDCCKQISKQNQKCYSAQCHATAYAIAKGLNLPQDKFSISFQSRLGKDPWIQPYTSAVIDHLAKQGKKKVLVMCPAFVCDCLETTFEIGIEYAHAFQKAGGEKLELVKGLNDHPRWIETLQELVIAEK
jgi:ferrochelatase